MSINESRAELERAISEFIEADISSVPDEELGELLDSLDRALEEELGAEFYEDVIEATKNAAALAGKVAPVAKAIKAGKGLVGAAAAIDKALNGSKPPASPGDGYAPGIRNDLGSGVPGGIELEDILQSQIDAIEHELFNRRENYPFAGPESEDVPAVDYNGRRGDDSSVKPGNLDYSGKQINFGKSLGDVRKEARESDYLPMNSNPLEGPQGAQGGSTGNNPFQPPKIEPPQPLTESRISYHGRDDGDDGNDNNYSYSGGGSYDGGIGAPPGCTVLVWWWVKWGKFP